MNREMRFASGTFAVPEALPFQSDGSENVARKSLTGIGIEISLHVPS
jgi:hypothetical protein